MEACPVGYMKGTMIISESQLSGEVDAGTRGTFKIFGSVDPRGRLEDAYMQGKYFFVLTGKMLGDGSVGLARGAGRASECSVGNFYLTPVGQE